jgi:DNA invertase Pin-like site-specific DNA recombinase
MAKRSENGKGSSKSTSSGSKSSVNSNGHAHGQRVAYIRVSSIDQNTDRQLEGVGVDREFTDKCSGKDMHRPQLQEMLRFVREGDTVVCHSMDRLGRNLTDLRQLVTELTGRGIVVEFVKEHLAFTGDENPMNTLLLSLLGAVAEFERSMIRERQREGIAIAKAKGDVYKGRKPSLTDEQAQELRRRSGAGERKAALAREYGISRETLYAYLRTSK